MALPALARFFHNFFHKTPWFVSPMKVPCESCAKNGRLNQPSLDCENYQSLEKYTCAAKVQDSTETIPIFQKHDEASSIQLFYDLFFVANLSSCTLNHKIDSLETLVSYVGFFTLLWFTWFTTIMFDVRFAIDSWFTRLSKACSLGIMTAFAISSVFFGSSDGTNFGHSTQMISIVLMSSRLLLVVQYSAVLLAAYYRHVDKLVIKAFAMTISTHLVAAFSFMSIYYLDSSGKSSYGSPGWYVNLASWYQCNANGAEVCHQHRGSDCLAYHILFVSFNGLQK
jgi:hypothetical protein